MKDPGLLLSLPLNAGPTRASGVAGGESEPPAEILNFLEGGDFARWKPFPFHFLGATVSGRPVPTSTWLKAGRSGDGLHFLAVSPEPLRAGETIAILIDPVGDLEGYYEIGVSSVGHLQSAILRRSRSGHKRNAHWVCEGAKGELLAQEGGGWSAELFIPYRSLADHAPARNEEWAINAQRTHSDGVRTTLERLPRFRRAIFQGMEDLH